ncbi:hypothetical protein JF546_17085 [Nitratireductor aquimarinus]|uniref:phage regulatory CII family protein n=1 Tax=Nitratireductor TaxID=245876 RepID=UPI000DDF5E91|nr:MULTISPECIES: phage regulatory CII family protein [Nitratireductor]MBN7764026.1 hypothetical protein [Nitratireductor aquibiodomus]MBN8244733.1 hypothetical protein [Nitratireductor aquimarinus]MBY6133120.1 hypothetical protein [Nitratireductor aquimarinus]MCA1305054.1 hypothetical protein [Nitratireductor aquimarinus]MCV0352811.1 hypothetical protein [Nitratireductor sp.]
MIPNANARHYRIKAAQRDMISAAGGIERVAEIVGYSKSTVGRWNNGDSPDLMPLDALISLESETGMPVMTTALAELSGRRLSDPKEVADAEADIMRGYAGLCSKAGEMMAMMAEAMSDGKITPAEATAYDRRLSELEDILSACRRQAASVRGAGGFSVVSGGAG